MGIAPYCYSLPFVGNLYGLAKDIRGDPFKLNRPKVDYPGSCCVAAVESSVWVLCSGLRQVFRFLYFFIVISLIFYYILKLKVLNILYYKSYKFNLICVKLKCLVYIFVRRILQKSHFIFFQISKRFIITAYSNNIEAKLWINKAIHSATTQSRFARLIMLFIHFYYRVIMQS